jgi:hypothetical protein
MHGCGDCVAERQAHIIFQRLTGDAGAEGSWPMAVGERRVALQLPGIS